MAIMRESLKRITCLVLFLTTCIASAYDEELPWTFGGLDWSSDGRYIAVGTSHGAHIHNSDDLSLNTVFGDGYVGGLAWSKSGLKLAYSQDAENQIVVQDLENGDKVDLVYPERPGDQAFLASSIAWSPGNGSVAAGGARWQIVVWDVESRRIYTEISVFPLDPSGITQIDWRPGGVDIMSGSISNGIAIWNFYTGYLIDFMWNTYGSNSPARWNSDGNMIAAGDNPINVWKVKPDRQHTAWDELGGELAHRLEYNLDRLFGLSWHPDSTKLAFVFSHSESGNLPEPDFSRDGALIWDISSDSTVLLPGVFITEMTRTHKVIEWSPDGSRLAAISSDGRIVIWDAHTFEVAAEYAGYRSILDYYAENP